MPTLEFPPTPVRLGDTQPRNLIAHNTALGFFASAPQRMAPHLVLANQPDTPRSIKQIADELIEVADFANKLTNPDVRHIKDRLSELLDPFKLPEDTSYVKRVGRIAVVHNETGSAMVPLATLLTGRWLVARETTEKLIPKSVTRRTYHGTRIAMLQHCVEGRANINFIADDLGMSVLVARTYVRQLKNRGLLTRSSKYHNASYRVTASSRPLVALWATELHSLGDDDYRSALRNNVLPEIIGSPQLYGTLARAALTDILKTKRLVSRSRKRTLTSQEVDELWDEESEESYE